MITSSDRALAARWQELRAAGRTALVPYLTAGFPDAPTCRAALRAAVASGADLLELGVPYSDPLADGPTIQRASQVALDRGTDLARVLDLLRDLESPVPVVLFSYLNPILAYGPERFLSDAAAAGAAGLLVVDLPAGADPALEARLRDGRMDLIRSVAPTTPLERMAAAVAGAAGFVYLISRLGVTGTRDALAATLGETVRRVRAVTDLPIAVGFGIATGPQARAVAEVADGVVVGSAVIEALERGGPDEVAELIGELRAAVDGAADEGDRA